MDPPEPTAAELVAAAAELLNHGSTDEAFTEAQALFRRALDLDPNLRAAEYGLEQCQRALGAADGRAAEALAKAEEGAELLNAAVELEHFDRAIEAFEEALRLELGCDLAHYGLEQARKGREFWEKSQHGEAEAEGEGGSTGAGSTSWSRWSIRGIKEGAKGAMDASPDRLRVDLGRFNLGRLERLVGPHLRGTPEPELEPEPEPEPEPEHELQPDALPLPGVGEAQPPEGAEAGEEEVAVESLLARMGGMIDELDQEEGLDAATASAQPSPAPDQSSRAPADGG